jgi:hypothetical protein
MQNNNLKMTRLDKDFMLKMSVTFVSMFGLYILWGTTHFIAAHLYVHWCVPATFFGVILSPFRALMPHCQAFRWAIYNGGNNINTMWIMIGIWLMKYYKPIRE